MALNSNNYLATDLVWTPYENHKSLPILKQIAFRKDGKIKFGVVQQSATSTILIIEGRFYFDHEKFLTGSEWSVIDFVFEETGE